MTTIIEKIIARKPVTAKGRELVLITTSSNAQIWANKSQVSDAAEQVTYVTHKAGSEYTRKDGTKGKRTVDTNEFVGCGNATKLDNSKALLEFVLAKGITPTFSLS